MNAQLEKISVQKKAPYGTKSLSIEKIEAIQNKNPKWEQLASHKLFIFLEYKMA